MYSKDITAAFVHHKALTKARQVSLSPGPCDLIAASVSVFHVQNVSFSSDANCSAVLMGLLLAMLLPDLPTLNWAVERVALDHGVVKET